MGHTAKELIAIAEAEIGYLEKRSNQQLDSKTDNAGYKNWTKYARDLAKAGYYNGNKNGYEWCDVFVDWCFWKLCGESKSEAEAMECQTGLYGAGCVWSAKYYNDKGRLYKSNPKVGDQIFFKDSSGDACHTGIVYKVDSSYVYTIEGNTSGASGVIANGGGVCEKKYKLNYSRIYGYGRPLFDVDETAATAPTISGAKADSSIDTVKEVQLWLNQNYSAGLTLDGLYGTLTRRALTKALQKELGVAVDGIYGKNTNAAVKKNNLQRGDTGALVRVLQGFLVCHGYKSAYIDGDFGSGTETALKSFQTAYKLSVDGIAGTETFSTLCS